MSLRLRAGLAAVLWVWAGAVAANAEPDRLVPWRKTPRWKPVW